MLLAENIKEMSMTDLAHNMYFVKEVNGERWAWYRDYDREISCIDLVREIANKNIEELRDSIGDDEEESFFSDDDYTNEILFNWLQFDIGCIEGLLAMYYQAMWSLAEVREYAKSK